MPVTEDHVSAADLDAFAQEWATAIIDTSYVPMSRAEIEEFLLELSG
ncbi:MAG: hypothetical protein JOZ47_02820, partial [Kutzneria sp.]|nr:hypothetical protein [Kutzneria sp.]